MIDKLEYLLALARERNFGRAAEQCGVTQPTFSAGIKQLEDTLGVMLVQRTSRFLGFTSEGERVLDWARGIVADTRAMRQEMQTRRITDNLRHAAGGGPEPPLESNSMIVLFPHVRPGRWAGVMREKLADTLGLPERLRWIPIVEPGVVHKIGLVVPPREPM